MSSASPAGSNPSFSMSAYMVPSTRNSYASETDEDMASLPSESSDDSDVDTLSDDYSDAEAEWRESIEQLELLLTMVLVPFIGKYLGRRCAYWGRCEYTTAQQEFVLIRVLQVGQDSCSGNTRSRLSSGTRRSSKGRVSSRRLQLYDEFSTCFDIEGASPGIPRFISTPAISTIWTGFDSLSNGIGKVSFGVQGRKRQGLGTI